MESEPVTPPRPRRGSGSDSPVKDVKRESSSRCPGSSLRWKVIRVSLKDLVIYRKDGGPEEFSMPRLKRKKRLASDRPTSPGYALLHYGFFSDHYQRWFRIRRQPRTGLRRSGGLRQPWALPADGAQFGCDSTWIADRSGVSKKQLRESRRTTPISRRRLDVGDYVRKAQDCVVFARGREVLWELHQDALGPTRRFDSVRHVVDVVDEKLADVGLPWSVATQMPSLRRAISRCQHGDLSVLNVADGKVHFAPRLIPEVFPNLHCHPFDQLFPGDVGLTVSLMTTTSRQFVGKLRSLDAETRSFCLETVRGVGPNEVHDAIVFREQQLAHVGVILSVRHGQAHEPEACRAHAS